MKWLTITKRGNMNKVNEFDVGGSIVKQDETYIIKDNKLLNGLVLSSTKLYRGKQTRGHRHPGQEEVYFFVQGTGMMMVDNEKFRVISGDIILIPDGAFHRVINDGEMNLVFNCVFQGSRNH